MVEARGCVVQVGLVITPKRDNDPYKGVQRFAGSMHASLTQQREPLPFLNGCNHYSKLQFAT